MDSKVESKRGAYIKVKGNLLFPQAFDKCANLAKSFIRCEDLGQSREMCYEMLQELKSKPLSFTFLFSQSCTFVVNPLADLIVEEEASDATTLELGYILLNSGIAREAASSFFFKCFDVLMGVLHRHNDDREEDGFPLYAAKIMCTAIHIVDEVELVAKGIAKSNIFWHAISVRLQASTTDTPQGVLVALLYLARQCLSAVPITRAIIDDVESVLKCAAACSGTFSNDVVRGLAALFIVVSLSTEEDISTLSATVPQLAAFTCNATSKGNVYMTTVFRLAEELVEEDKKNGCYLRRINSAFSELKKRSFHTEGRLRSLERISGLLFLPQAEKTDSPTVCVSTAAVVLVPGAVRALFSAMCDVDEFTCGCACDIFSKLLSATSHSDKGTSDTIFSAQLSVVQSLIEMGTLYLLEDILADYSVRATVSVLSLLAAFVRFSPVSKAAVTSSRCVQRVVRSIHQLAQKNNLEEYVQTDERSTQVTLYFELLSLTLDEEKATVSESVLTDISTIISEAKSVAVGEAGMHTLAKLASLYPMAASLVLDFDFLNEAFEKEGETPSSLHRMLIKGSFDIMSEMVCKENSVITFEWIETLLAAVKRVGEWDAVSLFVSVWACVAKTLELSEEAREYMMDDETSELLERTIRTMIEKTAHEEEDYLPCLSPLVDVALYAPITVGELILTAMLSNTSHALPSTVLSIIDMCSLRRDELAVPLWTTTLVNCMVPGFVVCANEGDLHCIEERAIATASSSASSSLCFALQVFEAVVEKEKSVSNVPESVVVVDETPHEMDVYAEAVDVETLSRFIEKTVQATVSTDQCEASTGMVLLSATTNLLSTVMTRERPTTLSLSTLERTLEVCNNCFAWANAADVTTSTPLQMDVVANLLESYSNSAAKEENSTSGVGTTCYDDFITLVQFCDKLFDLGFISEALFAANPVCKKFVEKHVQPYIETSKACRSLYLKLNNE